jgi:SAM-dependent methyltransferase
MTGSPTSTCLLCGGTAEPIPALAPRPIVGCADCGFVFRPELDRATAERHYEGGRYEDREFAAGPPIGDTMDERRRHARARLRFVRRFAPAGRLLDVEAGLAGYEASGIEPSPAFARYAREQLGADVAHARLEELSASGSYDVITLWHVLEHLPDPLVGLQTLRRALEPNGALIVEVPNLAGSDARRLGPDWIHLDPEFHVSHFTASSLAGALEKADFEVRHRETLSLAGYMEWRHRIGPRQLFERIRRVRAGGPWRSSHPEHHEFLRVVAVPLTSGRTPPPAQEHGRQGA